eukprot:95085-Rhodomonas_salina.2
MCIRDRYLSGPILDLEGEGNVIDCVVRLLVVLPEFLYGRLRSRNSGHRQRCLGCVRTQGADSRPGLEQQIATPQPKLRDLGLARHSGPLKQVERPGSCQRVHGSDAA